MSKFSPNTLATISATLPAARMSFRAEVGMIVDTEHISDIMQDHGLYAGSRFLSNDTVIAYLEQQFTEHEVNKYLNYVLFKALEDCAERDFHYTFEKEW